MGFAVETLLENALPESIFTAEAALYISPLAKKRPAEPATFDLESAVFKFLANESKKVLLLAGDAGNGKSFFLHTLTQKLATEFKPGDWVPIRIELPGLRDPVTNLIPEGLGKKGLDAPSIEVLRTSGHPILLILDSYDEVNMSEGEFNNLYLANDLGNWPTMKVIFGCRTNYLYNMANFRDSFAPFNNESSQLDLLEEFYVAPFSVEMIDHYLKKFLALPSSETRWTLDEYKHHIERIYGLLEMVKNPFVLKIVAEVLPNIVKEHQELEPDQELSLLKRDLYIAYTNAFFRRQKFKLMKQGKLAKGNVESEFRSFSEKLAAAMFRHNTTVVHFNSEKPSESRGWERELFEDAKYQLARTGCPLKQVGVNVVAFMHDTLRDFFLAQNERS